MSSDAIPRDAEPRATTFAQSRERSTRRAAPRLGEGIRAGLLGATTIWIWLLIVDFITGRPLYTPGRLGRDLLGIIFPGVHTPMWADVLAFTLVHYALWALAGTLLVRAIAADARTHGGVLIFAATILILLQLAFVDITEIFARTAFPGAAWFAIFGGNLVGWLVTGLYLWRHHREIPELLRREGED